MQADWDKEAFLGSCLHSTIQELESWPESKKKHAIRYINRVIENDPMLKKISLKKYSNTLKEKFRSGLSPISQFDAYWRLQPPVARTQLGQFYTPELLVDHIISTCNVGFDSLLPSPYVADIACGSGVFLRKTIIAKVKNGNGPLEARVINAVRHTIGLDKEPIACSLSKLSIALVALNLSRDTSDLLFHRIVDSLPLPRVYTTDSLEKEEELRTYEKQANDERTILEIKGRSGEFHSGLGAIVSNFPFLEAKRMNKIDPNLKSWLKKRYPQLFAAFDLYIAFIYRSLELLATNGVLGVVLPNKFLIGKYGSHVRKFLLENHKILQISDCSRVENSFRNTGVYPIAFFVRKGKSKDEEKNEIFGLSVKSLSELSTATKTAIDANLFRLTGKNHTYFVPPSHRIELIRDFLTDRNFPRLGELVDLRTTVSFHKKGTREQFVKIRDLEKIKSNNFIFKYIGGKSYSRKNEVDMFTLNWDGYSIDYNPSHLKELDHTLPPLKNFLQPKVIFCQHSQRLRAYLDVNGEYVTKDVFPIAFPRKDPKKSLDVTTICAYFNSSLFTILYNSIHHGITISRGFYHYLPAFLEILPTVKPDSDAQKMLAEKVHRLQSLCSQENNRDKNREVIKTYDSLDKKVSQIHGLNENIHGELQREIIQAKIPFPWKIS